MTKDEVIKVQTPGIDWFGQPLVVDGNAGPKTQWWAGILLLHPTRVQIIKTALEYYRRRVKETAPNRGDGVDEFQEPAGIGLGNPWCIAFTSFVLVNDCRLTWPYHMSAYQLIAWAKATGRVVQDPLPGDLFAFLYPDSKTKEGHGGIVLGSDASWIADVDGNVGNAVAVGKRARRGLTFVRTVDAVPETTMPTLTDLLTLDSARALTR